ncbi:MAG TPA: glycosyltransferase, partial [Anaerolineales bacterium]
MAALPGIIEGLRAQGFEFVPVSSLIGLTRDQVMPPLPKSNLALVVASLNDLAFQLIGNVHWVISTLFLVGIVLGIARMLLIGILAVFEWRQARRKTYLAAYRPPVSVIVPAYNEEKVICNTVHSLLRSTYPNLDIVVVDDGSSDATYARVVEEFGNDPHVRVFTKPNGGKAQALNFGIQQTQAEVVVAQDADTIIQPDAVEKLVRHLADPQVGAVAGNAKVGNRINILTRWQALEYITSQNLDRRAFAVLNCITVVPGAIGAWRRLLVLEVGGFDNDTLAEDADLTLRILRMGYRIDYEEQAIALTEAPDMIGGFVKQRFRWMYGTLQAAWKHRGVIFRPRYGALGMFAIPNIFIFQVLFPLISPVMDFLLIGSVVG